MRESTGPSKTWTSRSRLAPRFDRVPIAGKGLGGEKGIDRAIVGYTEAIRLQPLIGVFYYARSRLQSQKKQYREAIDDLN